MINLAAEHLDSLQLLGLELVDVHEMSELVFTSSYFVFDRKLYQQMLGLFMGCKPSPIGAIVRVYTFERRSLYIDPHYLPTSSVYGRYVDDAGTIAQSEQSFVSTHSKEGVSTSILTIFPPRPCTVDMWMTQVL